MASLGLTESFTELRRYILFVYDVPFMSICGTNLEMLPIVWTVKLCESQLSENS